VPSRWRVLLEGPVGITVPVEAPHAVVSRWLDGGGTHRAPVKPYAISPPTVEGDCTVLEIRLLDDTLAVRLLEGVVPGDAVRLGAHRFRVRDTPTMLDAVPWPDLSSRCAPGAPWADENAWRVVFASPTTFRNGNRSSPLPAPQAVLRGLLSRWRTLHPDTAPTLDGPEPRSAWVSDIEGRTVVTRRAGTLLSGFVGHVRYACDPDRKPPRPPDPGRPPNPRTDPPDPPVVASLLHFAEYAGIGSHTPFGFGTVHLDRTWTTPPTPAETPRSAASRP
jgi:CRISPR-associated endoribonuclease Cas6